MLKALKTALVATREDLLNVRFSLNNEENVNPDSMSVQNAIEATEAALARLDTLLAD